MRASWCVALLGACVGTRSGLPGDERVVALDALDTMTECQYLHDAYVPRLIMCVANDTQFMIDDEEVAMCVSDHATLAMNNPDCTATVAQAEACQADLYAEPDSYYCEATPVPPMSCLPLHTAACTH